MITGASMEKALNRKWDPDYAAAESLLQGDTGLWVKNQAEADRLIRAVSPIKPSRKGSPTKGFWRKGRDFAQGTPPTNVLPAYPPKVGGGTRALKRRSDLDGGDSETSATGAAGGIAPKAKPRKVPPIPRIDATSIAQHLRPVPFCQAGGGRALVGRASTIPHAPRLMVDPFGNYVMQRLLDRSTPDQVDKLVAAVLEHEMVLSLSKDPFGSRVMQKVLSISEEKQRQKIVDVLMKEDIGHLICDPHANHVIHRIVELLPPDQTTAIAAFFSGEAETLCRHKFASRVLLRVICHAEPEIVRGLIEELCRSLPDLAYDQFGNYAVQQLLESGTESDQRIVIAGLQGGFTRMSMHKYASNVVEKSLRFGTQAEREGIIAEILNGDSFTLDQEMGEGEVAQSLQGVAVSPLVAIMVHPYGNYVVQRMVEYGSQSQQERIVSKISMLEGGLEKGKFGKHILSAVDIQRGCHHTAAADSGVLQERELRSCSPISEIILDAPPGSRTADGIVTAH